MHQICRVCDECYSWKRNSLFSLTRLLYNKKQAKKKIEE
ncbi:hypothetical protein BSI_42820 [Bacillus inaquosorum KCTC 13429]|uniref:Uncharacterized protein n=1 Tax=Bacillus inaquosorum KCTC 13429 TaxID=1236548 RepID=A0A9W5LEE0_9BACI|nr:hypothetical protein BSI_42820 [Bacillus inaquosorum KCTC 13429]